MKIEKIKSIKLIESELSLLKKRLKNLPINRTITINTSEIITEDILESDLIIISTTSSERFNITNQLINSGYKGNIILEKILTSDAKTLEKLEELLNHLNLRSMLING